MSDLLAGHAVTGGTVIPTSLIIRNTCAVPQVAAKIKEASDDGS
jgi:hypothetical protein